MFKNLSGHLRKLLPTIIMVGLAIVAGATDIFSSGVRDAVVKLFQEYASKLLPFAVSALIGGIILNVAYLLYQPLRDGLARAMSHSGASDRGKNLIMRGLQLFYWGAAILISLTIVAPDVLSKVFLGGSLLIAALTLALQGAANDFICGMLLQFSPRFKLGDDISIVGMDVKGKVKDIDYLSTEVQSADGMIRIPNREVWAKAVKVLDVQAQKSSIIMPSEEEFRRAKAGR